MRVIPQLAECLTKLQLHVSLPCSWAPQQRDAWEGEATRCPRPYATKFSFFSKELQLGLWLLNKVTSWLCFLHQGGENRSSEQEGQWDQLISLFTMSLNLHGINHLRENIKVVSQYRKYSRQLFFQVFTVHCIKFLLKPWAFLLKSSPPSSVQIVF